MRTVLQRRRSIGEAGRPASAQTQHLRLLSAESYRQRPESAPRDAHALPLAAYAGEVSSYRGDGASAGTPFTTFRHAPAQQRMAHEPGKLLDLHAALGPLHVRKKTAPLQRNCPMCDRDSAHSLGVDASDLTRSSGAAAASRIDSCDAPL